MSISKYFKGFIKYRFLLSELVKKGIRLKYRRSYLGILWTLLEPILTTIVLTLVFGTFFGRGDKTFPIYILTGRLLYSFYSQGSKAAMKSIRGNAGMIKKVYVPKYLYPLSSVLFNFIIFMISLIVLIGAMILLGVAPTWYLAQAFIPMLCLLLLTFGSGLILSTFSVFFRDLEYLWDVALMLIMYTCAIFYKVETLVKTGNGWVFKINPLYAIIDNFRSAVYGQAMDTTNLIIALSCSIGSVIVGAIVFYKNQDKFILHI